MRILLVLLVLVSGCKSFTGDTVRKSDFLFKGQSVELSIIDSSEFIRISNSSCISDRVRYTNFSDYYYAPDIESKFNIGIDWNTNTKPNSLYFFKYEGVKYFMFSSPGINFRCFQSIQDSFPTLLRKDLKIASFENIHLIFKYDSSRNELVAISEKSVLSPYPCIITKKFNCLFTTNNYCVVLNSFEAGIDQDEHGNSIDSNFQHTTLTVLSKYIPNRLSQFVFKDEMVKYVFQSNDSLFILTNKLTTSNEFNSFSFFHSGRGLRNRLYSTNEFNKYIIGQNHELVKLGTFKSNKHEIGEVIEELYYSPK